METYIQADHHIALTTPLGPDTLLLRGFRGTEALSQLFRFQLDADAVTGTAVPFEKLLGQKVSVRLDVNAGGRRYFNGICNRVSEGAPSLTFTPYRLEVVPKFWFLTRVAQSRIFQQVSVPDILRS